jgi:predicted HD phosphohydrolase
MADDEALAFERLPFALDAVALRQWDDIGKRQDARTPEMSHFMLLVPGLSQT